MLVRGSFVLLSFLGFSLTANAWQCPQRSAKEQIGEADIVFLAEVITERSFDLSGHVIEPIGLNGGANTQRYTIETEFSIKRVLKGTNLVGHKKRIRVTQDILFPTAAVYFADHDIDLIFANISEEAGFTTHLCLLPQHPIEEYNLN